MKIALLHDRVGGRGGGGGGVRQLLELGVALRDLCHEVVVCCHDHHPETVFAGPARELEVRGVERADLDRIRSRRDLIELHLRGMARVAELVPSDVDVVNAHEWPALHAGAVAARRLGVPHVWTRNDETFFEQAVLHGEASYPSHGPLRAAHAAFGLVDVRDLRRAAEVVVLDERNARMVRRAFRRSATIVRSGPSERFFDAPDRAEARRRLGVAPDAFRVLAFAIFFPHRRFEDVVDAVALLGDDVPGLEALVVGSDHGDPGYADLVERRVAERGVGDRVEVRRRGVGEDELRDLYAAADAYVFPNRIQTWGLAPLEALAARTPVVLSSGAGVHDVLAGRPGVHVVPPLRPDAIAAALRAIAADPAQPGLEDTRAWIRDELSRRRYAERMVELFRGARDAG